MVQQPKQKPLTPGQLEAERRRVHEADIKRQAEALKGTALTKVEPKLPAAPDKRLTHDEYIKSISYETLAGRLVQFSKDGVFVTKDDGAPISEDRTFRALCPSVVVGYIKFVLDGPPLREQGFLYDGYTPPPRESLGDLDQSTWELGLNGLPSDPWQHQICLPLQDVDSSEVFTFATTSVTGRRAVGNLLRHYDRMIKQTPNTYPLVRLRPSGFNHKDPRVGWVATPSFQAVGRAPADDGMAPDKPTPTNPNDEFGDSVPY